MVRMMNNQDVYIDWSKAPEGTTHVFVYNPLGWCNGVPSQNIFWEKWVGGVVYERIGRDWIYYNVVNEVGHSTRIKKPEEKVMSNNSLEQNIERMEKELSEMKARLKAGEKWEPKGGDWTVDWRGRVVRSTGAKDNNTFGVMFQTQQQAEIASKLMRERNRIIQYVLEHVPYWSFEFQPFKPNYYVYYDYYDKQWNRSHIEFTKGQHIFMPEWVAKKLTDDLNSGRVEL